jgi:hypothetical protein
MNELVLAGSIPSVHFKVMTSGSDVIANKRLLDRWKVVTPRWASVASPFSLLDGTWRILRTSKKYRFQNFTIYMFHSLRFSEHDAPRTLHVSISALLHSCKLLDGLGKAFPTTNNAFNTLQSRPSTQYTSKEGD